MQLEKYAYQSKLRDIPPLMKCIIGIFTMILCISTTKIVFHMIVICLMVGVVSIASKMTVKKMFHILCIPMGFILLSCVVVGFGSSDIKEKMLWGMAIHNRFYGITKSGFFLGMHLMLKSMSAVTCMYFISFTTPMTELFILLRRTKIPVYLIEITELIYRFIFVLYEAKDKISIAQQNRFGYETLKSRYHSMGLLIAKLFVRSMHQAERTTQAMMARGYDGCDIQIDVPYQKVSRKQWGITILILMGIIGLFFCI